MLYTAYSDANCKNKMKYSDYLKTLFGPTAIAPPNLEFPMRSTPGSEDQWLDLGRVPTGSPSQTGRVLTQWSWFQGCSEQVRTSAPSMLICSTRKLEWAQSKCRLHAELDDA